MRASVLVLALVLTPAAFGQHRKTSRVDGKTFAEWVEALGSNSGSAVRIAKALAGFENASSPDYCCGPVLPKDAKRYVPLLIERLSDRNATVREHLAFTLGAVGPDAAAAAKPLAKLLADPLLSVRQGAAYGLRGLGPHALPALEALAKALAASTDEDLRLYCVEALSRLGPASKRRAVPALKACLDDEDARVRAAALTGLAVAREPSVRERLVKLATEADDHLDQEAAIRGLAHYGARVALAPLGKVVRTTVDSELAEAACASLVRLGGAGAAKALIPGLRNKDEDVQLAVALALGRLGPAGLPALPLLIALALNEKVDEELRGAAALAIGGGIDPHKDYRPVLGLGPTAAEQAVPALTAVLDRIDIGVAEPQLMKRVAFALGRFGAAAASALPTLRALAGHKDLDADDEDHVAVIKQAQLAIEAIRSAQDRRSQAPAKAKSSKPKTLQPVTPKPSRKAPGE